MGRFCLNCGHRVGSPVPPAEPPIAIPTEGAATPTGRTLPTWVPWALGALLVAILFVVLASCLGGEDDEPVATTTGNPTTGSVDQGEPAQVVNLTPRAKVSAPKAAPATEDLDGSLVDYAPRNMLDGFATTAWRTPGDATGETITLTLRRPATIRRVGIVNGFAKQVPSGTGLVDWYPNNRRVTAVEWVFDDGTTHRHDLAEKPKMQRLTIDPVTTTTVQLRLIGVTEPGPGVLGRDYTAISELLLAGTPAT